MVAYAKPTEQHVLALTWAAGIAQLQQWETAWRTLAASYRAVADTDRAEEAEKTAAWFGNLAQLADLKGTPSYDAMTALDAEDE